MNYIEMLSFTRISLITGTPEVGGLTSIQALELVRGCRGLNIIGADLVEVGWCVVRDSLHDVFLSVPIAPRLVIIVNSC